MSADIIYALEQLEKERGLKKEVLISTIEVAIASAYKKYFGQTQDIKVVFDRSNGDVKVFEKKEDDTIGDEVTPKQFGRIAAQTAAQVVKQKIREAERGMIYDEFSEKEGEIVNGIILRIERKNVIIDLGKAEAILTVPEQIEGEEYKINSRIKTYVIEVKKTSKDTQIMVSRTHPNLVKRLFELEVPEIYEGIVEIKSVSREAGSRTKIAVFSKNDDVDPVGACVGQRGTRVQNIVDELRGEKIDIIKWNINSIEYISSSLSPAKVIRVDINELEKSAKVTVPDYQLSLAIGKEGQNARLAAKLTGWKIDIKSESQLRAAIEQQLLNFKEDFEDTFDEDTDIDNGY